MRSTRRGLPSRDPAGTAGAITWGYRITATDLDRRNAREHRGTTTTGNATLDGVELQFASRDAVPGAASYKVYRTTVGVGAVSPLTTGFIRRDGNEAIV